MKRSLRKRMARAEANPEASVDWSSVPVIDPEKLEAGRYKFSSPSENRSQERISHRELSHVSMSLRAPGGAWLPVRLWDFTSLSFGVIYNAVEGAWPAPAGAESDRSSSAGEAVVPGIRVGDEVEIRIRIGAGEDFEVWCSVKNMSRGKEGIRIGLRRLDVNFPQAVDLDRRAAFRLPLSPTLSLKARISHPFLFGHWSTLIVSDVNRDMGFSFLSEDPSILLFEGMEIRIQFELARHRSTPMLARVAWIHATEADQVRFGAACMDMPWDLHNGICDYLLFSRQWTPGRLRDAGFLARRVKSRLRFRSVKTMEDYAEVLYLRRDAYVGAGKKSKDTRPEEMAGRLDGQSRILMAWHQDKLVGSLTFTFPASEDEVLDSQAAFPGRKYPVAIPPKASLIEVSRLCIDEEYRGTDLLQGLFEHGAKHFLLSDRYWLLTSAVAELLPLYERIGFMNLGASYKHPALNNLEHHLIAAHRDTFLWGRGVNLLVWDSIFGDMVRHLLDRKLIRVARPLAMLIRAKLWFGPLSKRILENRSAQAFRKHLEVLRRGYDRPRPVPRPKVAADEMQAEDFLPADEGEPA